MEFVDRNVAETVVYAMGFARVVALLGPRQAGKSTLVRKLAEEQLSADYLSLDDEPVRSLAAGDPAGFIAARGRCTVIDEVQRAPELLLAIKSRVDRDTVPGQFLITGSANLRRIPTVSDALPGRVDYLTSASTPGRSRCRRSGQADLAGLSGSAAARGARSRMARGNLRRRDL